VLGLFHPGADVLAGADEKVLRPCLVALAEILFKGAHEFQMRLPVIQVVERTLPGRDFISGLCHSRYRKFKLTAQMWRIALKPDALRQQCVPVLVQECLDRGASGLCHANMNDGLHRLSDGAGHNAAPAGKRCLVPGWLWRETPAKSRKRAAQAGSFGEVNFISGAAMGNFLSIFNQTQR
jgi:hypothetical protein